MEIVCGWRPAIDAVVVETSADGVSGPLVIVVLSLPVSVALPETVCGMRLCARTSGRFIVEGTPVGPGAGRHQRGSVDRQQGTDDARRADGDDVRNRTSQQTGTAAASHHLTVSLTRATDASGTFIPNNRCG